MFGLGMIEHEDVIQIYDRRIFFEPQDIIHHPHEFFRRISQDKRHEQLFKMSFFIFEGCSPYIILFYHNLVVSILYICLTK
jgi:hypothetical protein